MFGLGFSVPAQNAAIQTVIPAEHRGKITALYLFIYSVIGVALSPTITGILTDYVFRDESQIRWSIFLPAVIVVPASLFIVLLGVKPYGLEVQRLRALESANA